MSTTPPIHGTWHRLNLDESAVCARWDDACRAARDVPAFGHSAAWARVLRRVYGTTCRGAYCDFHDGFRLLPLHEVRTLTGKRRLASVPYASYGGPLPADGAADSATVAAAVPAGAAPLLLRTVAPEAADPAALPATTDRVTMWLDLPADVDTLWKSFPAKVRNQVRKAEREGVTVAAGRAEMLPDFYALYSRRMHELGTPAHVPAFFAALLEEFPEAEILVARHQEEAVGTVFDIGWGPWRVNLYGATLFARRALCANNLVYWKSLERAIGSGRTRYDFGRSRLPSGQYDFKRQWGARPHLIREALLVHDGTGWRRNETAGEGPLLRLLAKGWSRLPLPLANLLNRGKLRRFLF